MVLFLKLWLIWVLIKKLKKYKDKEIDDKVLELANDFKNFQDDIIKKLKEYL